MRGRGRCLFRRTCALALVSALTLAGGAAAVPWPPADGPGVLFVHFGEEHWNDDDGLTLLPKVVEDTARYKPNLVTMSADKANDGTVDELTRWREIMEAYDRAGVPYFAAVGNHDRKAPPGQPGGASPFGDIGIYREVFSGRPYPMGDAAPYADPRLRPRERPAEDPAGAASHYFVDYANVRWIFIDNSCFSIVNCDPLQAPSGQNPDNRPQYEFMRRVANEARDAGMHIFVVMHMPTRDPGDQTYRDPVALNHVMGKGATTDNETFEQVAEEVGVDAVFLAHIKAQFVYRGRGDIPYYIDGGAGGELYTEGPVGTDHGYWHGYRLVRVDGERITTDTVPIFIPGTLRIEGPDTGDRGAQLQFEGFGRQPVFVNPAKVEALELRDPDPRPRSGPAGTDVAAVLAWGGPLLLFGLLGAALWLRTPAGAPRTRLARAAAVPALAAVTVAAAITVTAVAQQSEPTSTKKENLPAPARIWSTSNPAVLSPVPAIDDDPRRDARTQTEDGLFRANCPGRAAIELTSGWESVRKRVTVPRSRSVPIVRKVVRRARVVRRGRRTRLATVRYAQPGQLLARILRGRRTVATLADRCVTTQAASVRWNGRAKRGRYTLKLSFRSDRRTIHRRFRFRVRVRVR